MRWVLPLGLALVVFLSACSGGDNGVPTASPSPEPSASATATTSPTASPPPTVNPNLITRSPDIDFPADTAMIIESGCWGCDGGAGDFVRVYRDPSGAVRSESLLSAVQSRLPRHTIVSPSGETYDFPAFVNGSAMTQDASVMAVSFCIKGSCVFSGLGSFEADSEGVAFRSLNGGITWQEVGRGGPVFRVDAVLADGRVLAGHGSQDNGVVDYAVLPDNAPVQAPADGVYPVTSGNNIFWGTNDGRLLRADGTVFLGTPIEAHSYARSVAGTFDDSGKASALAFWEMPMPGTGARPAGYIDRWAIAELGRVDGQTQIVRQWEIDGYLWTIGSWSPKDDRAIISFYSEDDPQYASPVPAVLDLRTGTYDLIPGPFKSDRPGISSLGRTAVHAVQTGPFARVTGTGSCLKVRAEPSLSGEVLACAADGVLLRDLDGDTRITDGAEWVSVMTPGGVQGWASGAFLER